MNDNDENLNEFIAKSLKDENPELFQQILEKFDCEKTIPKKDNNETNFVKIIQGLNDSLSKLQTENENLKNQYTMAKVEFNDFIRQSKEQINEAKTQSIKKFAIEIISLINIIDLAKKSCQHDHNILIGIEMLEKQFLEVLKKFNIEKININIGDTFNEEICEAVDKTTGGIQNTISKIISMPYKFHEYLLIPGKVIVFE